MCILEIISSFDSVSKVYRKLVQWIALSWQEMLLMIELVPLMPPRLYGETLSRVGVTRFPELPWASQLPYISLQTLANRLHEKQLSSPAFLDDRITFLTQLIFLHIKTGSPKRGSARSRRGNQSIRQRCCQFDSGKQESIFFLFSPINAR